MDLTNIRQTITSVQFARLTNPSLAALPRAGLWSVGIDVREPNETWGEGVSSTYLLFMVTQGVVWLPAFPQVRAQAGSALVIPARSAKNLHCGAEGVVATWCHWLPTSRQAAQFGADVRSIPIRHAAVIGPLTQSLIYESYQAGDAEHRNLGRTISATWLQIVDATLSDSSQVADQWTAALGTLWSQVMQRPDYPWDVRSLAAAIYISAPHLHRLVRQRYDCGPMAEVNRLRLERGRELLGEGNSTIESIANRVGFATAGAFSDAFLRRFGQRPGSMRKA